jgi:hypothetical protein
VQWTKSKQRGFWASRSSRLKDTVSPGKGLVTSVSRVVRYREINLWVVEIRAARSPRCPGATAKPPELHAAPSHVPSNLAVIWCLY